jgi:hypothetical protein
MRAVAVVVLMLSSSCLKPSGEITCGDNICPSTSVCLPNGSCALSQDVAACDSHVDGDSCQTPVFVGTCRSGVCYPPVCGDGLVEASEQCDGAVTGVDCVAYGFDTGVPLCTNCVLDVVHSCVRFGWRLLTTVTADIAWTNGSRVAAIRRDNSGVEVEQAGQVLAALDQPDFYFLAGNLNTVLAASRSALWLFDGSFSQFDTTALGLDANIGIQRVQIDPTGTIYVETTGATSCSIWSHTPSSTWQQIRTTPASNDCQFLLVEDGAVLLAVANGAGARVLAWSGTQWLPTGLTTAEPIFDMRSHAAALYAATSTKVVTFAAGTTTVYDEAAAQVIPLPSGLYAGGGYGDAIDRIQSATWIETVIAPIQGNLISDEAGNMYMVGNGVYVYSGIEYAERFSPATSIDDLSMLENGMPIAVGVSQAMVPAPQNRISWTYTVLPYSAKAVAGIDDMNFFVTDGSKINHVLNGTVSLLATLPTGGIRDLWMHGTTLYAITDTASYAIPAMTLNPLTPPAGLSTCMLTSLAGNATDVFASAICGSSGSVWILNGSAWTEVHHTTTRPSAVAADDAGDLFTAGADGGERFVGGTWTADPDSIGVYLAATAPDDVWASAGLTPVLHWDGSTWSRVGVAGANRPHVIASPRQVTISGVTSPVLMR